jgi:hypothetical protein
MRKTFNQQWRCDEDDNVDSRDTTDMFVCIDADNVGDKLELLLLDENIDDAAALNYAIRDAMRKMCETVNAEPTAELLMVGCDDIIVKLSSVAVDSMVTRIRSEFHSATGFTLTVGIGSSLRIALERLRRGKLVGKNIVISE